MNKETDEGEIQISRDCLKLLCESPLDKWIFLISELKVWTHYTERKVYPTKKDSRLSVVRRKSFNVRPDGRERNSTELENSPEKIKSFSKLKKGLVKGNNTHEYTSFKIK